ncbi:uncharacterized protein K02A2.6-like [Aricia agestis]|uniref:uncharacterized protein K02A2.6-like n=1 Tax=Aricia agestis TaxID=91739 RepID=UPI001C207101|nr:uncharacterized protein K02A2.6-like [Aricia agestis]
MSEKENLRDQFVSGPASDEMRSRLFAEPDLTYKRAVELAMALEAAERHAETSGAGTAGTVGAAGAAGATAVHRLGSGGGRAGRRPSGGGGSGSGGGGRLCWRCGRGHPPDRCRFRNFSCDRCGAKGHLKVMCKTGVERRREPSDSEVFMNKKQLHNIAESSESEYDDFFKICVNGSNDKPYVLKIIVNSVPISFEVDTGSKISAINCEFYRKYFSHSKISGTKLKLHSYTGGTIEPLGFIIVSAQCVDAHGETRAARALPLYVIPGGGPPLLGRAWLRCLHLDKINIALYNIESHGESEHIVQKLSREFADVFAPGLGTCTSRFSLRLRDSKPIFIKARNLPLAMRKPVEAELDRLVQEGTIVKIQNSEYGTPIVPVVKRNGDIRICGDYKVTVNPQLVREPYPLPRIEELYATLSGAQVFSKIDLAHAYEQFLLDDDSQACTAISTHVGTFKYIRTPYGLSCIPEKFQKFMEEVMRGVPMTVVFIDDICVGGVSFSDNLRNLREVLARLQNVGLRIKFDKCEFFKSKVCYLGHVIDKNGLHPDDKKVAAILKAPRPEDVTQLKAFLGLVNYYGKFIAHLSTILYPLYKLLKKDTPWKWNTTCDEAFSQIKRMLSSDVVLAHYDPNVELVLSVDSSAYGIGAVLAHRYKDGSEKPICYSSRTLSSAELSYSQLDKEALAIYFGVIKNHQYLYGRNFTIRTDHKPLSHIFGDKIGIPQSAASRLQRYAARLAAYTFSIEWINSASNAPADCLSRLPLQSKYVTEDDDSISYLFFIENEFPINYKDIAKATARGSILRNVVRYISVGWPKDVSHKEKCYFDRRKDLLIENGCIVFNYRIVVPPVYRKKILAELHEGHLGIVKMKSIARSYVYWPGIDAEIENICKSCSACRQQRDLPRTPLSRRGSSPRAPGRGSMRTSASTRANTI